jgi:hypothetical protein
MATIQPNQNWYVQSNPKDVRNSLIISTGSILLLVLLLFLITYTTPDPPPVAHLLLEEDVLQDVEVEALLIADGGSAEGGGTPSNDERSEPMEQTEQHLTYKGQEPIQSGKSNHTTGNNANNPSSSPHKANNPFGDGGTGGGEEGGNGGLFGNGNGTGGEGNGEGDGYGDGRDRIRINDPVLPKYNTDIDLKVHLKLTVSGSGDVTNAVCIKSKTTTTDQSIINDVVRQVIKQVRYKKDPKDRPAFCFFTVKVNAN